MQVSLTVEPRYAANWSALLAWFVWLWWVYLDVFGSSQTCGHDVFAERTGLLLFGWVNSICWWCDLQQIFCDGFVTEFHSSFDLAVYRSISWNLWRVWMFLASLVNLIWMLDCWFMGQNQFFSFSMTSASYFSRKRRFNKWWNHERLHGIFRVGVW